MRLRVGVTRRPIVSPIYPRARPLTDRAFTSTMARRVFRDFPKESFTTGSRDVWIKYGATEDSKKKGSQQK